MMEKWNPESFRKEILLLLKTRTGSNSSEGVPLAQHSNIPIFQHSNNFYHVQQKKNITTIKEGGYLIQIKKKLRLSLLLFFSAHLLLAQDIEDKSITEQLWLDYNPRFSLSEKVDAYGDIGARTVFPNEWYRFVIGPSIRRKRPKLILKKLYYKEELHFGIRFFFTANKSFSNRLEIRPFQGYKLSWPNRPLIVLQHYVRLEERFDIETSNWINTFGLRLRYMAKLTLKFKGDLIAFNKRLYIPIRIEGFWNLKGAQQFNDVVRITPGIGYEFFSTWKAEIDVSYHYTRNTIEDNFATNDFVFRLRVFHTLQKKSDNKINERD